VVNNLLRALFWSAATFALIMAALPQPPKLPGTPSDKMTHILAFTCLALLGSAAYRQFAPLKLVVALSAFGAFIEVVQLIPVLNRDAELLDWLADTAAVIAAVMAVYAWRRFGAPAK
jgi:VanZ family protein